MYPKWAIMRLTKLAPLFLLPILLSCGKKDRMPPYPPPPVTVEVPAVKSPEFVRVLLDESFDSIRIEGARRADVLKVCFLDGELRLVSVRGQSEELLESGSGFRIEPAPGDFLRLEGRRYRGIMEVFINPVVVPVAVNKISIEEYLQGVVPSELGPLKFPQLEAQKAQAVAARTFTVKNLGGNARFGFDLFSDHRSQVYLGLDSEQPLSSRGIRETEGIVAMYQEELIWALYSSTCGGQTEAFHEIFKGGPIDYLRGGAPCHDENSPYHSWEERIDIGTVQPKLDQYAAVGRLMHLEPLRRSRAGRLVEMRFVGDRGEEVLAGNDIRFALGLMSNFITAMRPIKDSSGFVRELAVRGKGWGHGVGMCQMGAVEMASKGQKYQEILKHYYQGIALNNYK